MGESRPASEAQMVLRFEDPDMWVYLFADGYTDYNYVEVTECTDCEPWEFWRNTCARGKGWAETQAYRHVVPVIDAAFEAMKEEGGGQT